MTYFKSKSLFLISFCRQALVLPTFVILSSCIGTIEDSATINTRTAADLTIYFDGVSSGAGIAHNKIALKFKSASGGSGRFAYRVYPNGSANPTASASAGSLSIDAQGYYSIVVDGLSIATKYSFLVKAFDLVSNAEDSNTKEVDATTLNYKTPIFDGATTVTNVAGIAGETSLTVNWNVAAPAESSSNPFIDNPYAISGYNIYIGQSQDAMTLYTSIGSPANKRPNETSATITGLTAGTNYYVMVRARDSFDDAKEDLNNKKVFKRTLTRESIKFDGLSSLSTPKNTQGFNTLALSWNPGTGSYSRYRVFVSQTPKSAFDPVIDVPKIPDITDLNTTSVTVNVPTPHSLYYVAVVACNSEQCTEFKGHNVVKTVRTTPPVAPFNGISQITQPEGAEGLSSLTLTWDSPDAARGVYNKIKIFQTTTGGIFNESTDVLSEWDPADAQTVGYTDLSDSGATIKGLASGTEFCFIAKAYSDNPVDSEKPNGHTHLNEVKKCAIPQYSTPGFAGISANCNARNSTNFTVTWSEPSPKGVFGFYEIFIKPENIGNPFDFNDAIDGEPGYTRIVTPTNATQYAFSGLLPGTTYKIGIKTYFENPSDGVIYRDTNLVTNTCVTERAKVEHLGWTDIVALGPKINGSVYPPVVIPERFVVPGVDEIPEEGLDGIWKNRFPQEFPSGSLYNGSNVPTASDQGMVRLAWKDMLLSGGIGYMFNFAGPTTGYNIYRKDYQSSHETVPPTVVNDVSAGTWTKLNSDLLPTKNVILNSAYYQFGEYTDYTVSRATLAENETKIYWYKVEAIVNGVKLDWETTPVDGVVKVILPPNNMALVHRWMANREFCETIGKTPMRSNNYRCVYNGLSSIDGYYDIEGSFLIDRFPIAMNVSMAGSPLACTTNTRLPPWGRAGDCVSWCSGGTSGCSSPTNGVEVAPHNALYFMAGTYGHIWNAYLRSGSNWSQFTNFMTGTTASVTRLPANSSTYVAGEGLGKRIFSNNAKLPMYNPYRSSMPAVAFCVSVIRYFAQVAEPFKTGTARKRISSIL